MKKSIGPNRSSISCLDGSITDPSFIAVHAPVVFRWTYSWAASLLIELLEISFNEGEYHQFFRHGFRCIVHAF